MENIVVVLLLPLSHLRAENVDVVSSLRSAPHDCDRPALSRLYAPRVVNAFDVDELTVRRERYEHVFARFDGRLRGLDVKDHFTSIVEPKSVYHDSVVRSGLAIILVRVGGPVVRACTRVGGEYLAAPVKLDRESVRMPVAHLLREARKRERERIHRVAALGRIAFHNHRIARRV